MLYPHESTAPCSTLVVRAAGSRLAVELDGEPVLEVDDLLPHLVGRVGIRAVDAELNVHELHVDPNP